MKSDIVGSVTLLLTQCEMKVHTGFTPERDTVGRNECRVYQSQQCYSMFTDLLVLIKGQCSDSATQGQCSDSATEGAVASRWWWWRWGGGVIH